MKYLIFKVLKTDTAASLVSLVSSEPENALIQYRSYRFRFESANAASKISDATLIKVRVDDPEWSAIVDNVEDSVPWLVTKDFVIKRWETYVDMTAGITTDMTPFEMIKKKDQFRCPTPKTDGWYVEPDTWDFLVVSMMQRENILLRGDSGCGKTTLVKYITERLGKDLGIVDMSILDGRTTLCGSTKLIDGNTVIKKAKFAEMIQTDQVVLLDELSRGDAMANNVLLPVLDSRRTLYMSELGDIDDVPVNENCTIWATANIGAEYSGTQNLDEALDNRFISIQLGYAPIDYETDLLMFRNKTLTRAQAKKLANMANESRVNSAISHVISTRKVLSIASYVAMGMDIKMATKQILAATYSGKGDISLDSLLRLLD